MNKYRTSAAPLPSLSLPSLRSLFFFALSFFKLLQVASIDEKKLQRNNICVRRR